MRNTPADGNGQGDGQHAFDFDFGRWKDALFAASASVDGIGPRRGWIMGRRLGW